MLASPPRWPEGLGAGGPPGGAGRGGGGGGGGLKQLIEWRDGRWSEKGGSYYSLAGRGLLVCVRIAVCWRVRY